MLPALNQGNHVVKLSSCLMGRRRGPGQEWTGRPLFAVSLGHSVRCPAVLCPIKIYPSLEYLKILVDIAPHQEYHSVALGDTVCTKDIRQESF
jgi:hypothetical protein